MSWDLSRVDVMPKNILIRSDGKMELKDQFSTGYSADETENEADRCLRRGLVCHERSKVSESPLSE